MIERCTSIWEPEAPAVLTVQEYMGTKRNIVYWNISGLLTLCDVNDWRCTSIWEPEAPADLTLSFNIFELIGIEFIETFQGY